MPWQRFEPQTFQSLGKHFTNELPCNLDVVKILILIGQSQSVTVKLGLHCVIFAARESERVLWNYRSDVLVNAAVYTGVSRPIVSLIKPGYHYKNKIE